MALWFWRNTAKMLQGSELLEVGLQIKPIFNIQTFSIFFIATWWMTVTIYTIQLQYWSRHGLHSARQSVRLPPCLQSAKWFYTSSCNFLCGKGQGKFGNKFQYLPQSCLETYQKPYFEAEQGSSGRGKDNILQWTQTFECMTHVKCFRRGLWDCSNKQPYQQYKCGTVCCNKTSQTYCSCSFGEWIYKDCYGQHMGEVTKQFAEGGN